MRDYYAGSHRKRRTNSFLIQGLDEEDKSVTYKCYGRERMTFGRISLDSLIVRVQDEQQEIQSVSQFLEEVFGLLV